MSEEGSKDLLLKLREPFDPSELEWKPGAKSGGKVLVMPYVNARAIMKRLDNVVGPLNWRDEYFELASGMGCRLYIRLTDWMCKEDATDIDKTGQNAVKGGVSDALKRAAVKWGIARYLYYLPKFWVETDARGKFTPPNLPDWAKPKK